MTYTPDQIVVFLSCNHTVKAPKGTKNGEDIHCPRCFRVRRVEETPCYVVYCKGAPGKRCPVSRSFGSLIFSSRQFATRHRMRFPSHTTVIRDRGTVVESYGPDDSQPALFEIPPVTARPRVVYVRGQGFTGWTESTTFPVVTPPF